MKLTADLKAAQCEGKVGFASFAMASITIKHRKKTGCQVYRCDFCGKFHVGALAIKSKPKKEKQWKFLTDEG